MPCSTTSAFPASFSSPSSSSCFSAAARSPSLMGEVGKGITAFKKGVDDGKKELEDNASVAARDVTPEEEEKDKV